MTLRLRDQFGSAPALHSWGYADAFLRAPERRAPLPCPAIWQDPKTGLWVPLDCLITLVAQAGAGSATTGNLTGVCSINSTTATLIVACLADYNAVAASGLTDSKGNTYTLITSNTIVLHRNQYFYCENPTVGAGHTFNTTNAAGASYPGLAVQAFAGTKTSGAWDTGPAAGVGYTKNTAGSGATVQAGSLTPTEAAEVVVTSQSGNSDTSESINGGFSTPQNGGAVTGTSFFAALSYLIQTTAAAANPTWTGADTVGGRAAIMASFKIAAAAGGADPVSQTVLLDEFAPAFFRAGSVH